MKRLRLLTLSLCTATSALAQERMLSDITVSGMISDLEERRTAVTQKTIIDRKGIENTGGLTVGEVLSKLPGVDAGVPSSDGSVALRSRGMARESVQVLVDGERPASNSRHAMLIISRMPSGELEQVEIIKGATAEFGNATPVTINLVTTRAKRKDNLEFKVTGGMRNSEPVTQMSLTKGGSNGAWSWIIPLSLSQYRTPVDKATERQDSTGGTRTLWQNDREKGRNTFTEEYFAPKLNWKEGKSSFSIWPTFFRAQGERKTFVDRTQYADPVNATGLSTVLQRNDREESSTRINRIRLEGDTDVSGNRVSGRLSLMSGEKDTNILRDSGATLGQATEARRRKENEVNSALRMDREWEGHLSTLGLEYITLDRKENQDYGGTYVDSAAYKAAEKQRVLWVQDEWAASKSVTLTGGLRGESLSLSSDGVSQTHGAVSPSLAARWTLSDNWIARSSIGSGIKMPKLDEISNAPIRSVNVNSPVEADVRGNASIKPEKSVNLELGLEHYWPNETAVAGINTYLRETQNFIERRTAQESGRWVERPYNEGDARHWGVELDGKVKTDKMGLYGGAFRTHLTLPHATVDDSRLGVSRAAREVPRYIWSLGYDQSLPALSSSAGLLLQQTGATRTDVPAEQWAETKARSILDAYWVRKIDRTINLRLALQNILGEDTRRTVRYYSAGQEWQVGGIDKQPRAILLTLEGKL